MKYVAVTKTARKKGRSREGAWIEMPQVGEMIRTWSNVAPARERGLKFKPLHDKLIAGTVAPARERGLKYAFSFFNFCFNSRSRKGAWIEM